MAAMEEKQVAEDMAEEKGKKAVLFRSREGAREQFRWWIADVEKGEFKPLSIETMPLVAPPGSTAVAVGSSICVLGGYHGDVFHYFSFRQPAEGWKEAARMLKKRLIPSVVAVDRSIYVFGDGSGTPFAEVFIPSSSGSGGGSGNGRDSGGNSSPGSSSAEEEVEFSGTWCPLEPPPDRLFNGVLDALLDSKRERILVLFSPFVLYAYHLKYKTWECIADKFVTWYQYSAAVDEHDILCCIGPAMNRDEFPMDDEWEIPFNLRAFDLVTKKWLPVEWTAPCNLRASTSGSYLLYIGNGDLCLATPWELVQYGKRVSTRYFTRIWFVTFSVHKTTNGVIIAKEKYSSSVEIPGNEHGIIAVQAI
ncbi:hypothetical protein Dimus_006908 [Dionaea muscipula]